MHISMMQFSAGLMPASKRFVETRSQLRYGAVPGDWGPPTNKQFCGAKSQSVYHSALLASFVPLYIDLLDRKAFSSVYSNISSHLLNILRKCGIFIVY